MEIERVTSDERANFPFLVQRLNTENWNTSEGFVSEKAAVDFATELAEGYPSLRVRIQHCKGGHIVVEIPPAYEHLTQEGQVPYKVALWSNRAPPPALNSKVHVRLNGLGEGRVTGYAVSDGYLGVMVQLTGPRPAWHVQQNPTNAPGLVFGSELRL